MPKLNRQARRALTEERRKQILTAAAQVFAEKGFDRATIADIARAAGVAEGSIYNYFKNKGDLLVSIPRQVVESPLANVSARMASLATAPLPPEDMLKLIARNIVNTVQQNAPIFRILISTLPTMNKATREKYLNQVILYATTLLGRYIKEQSASGVFRPELDADTHARAFVGMFFPFVMIREVLQAESEKDWTYDQIIDALVPLFLRGALSDTARAPSKQRQKISVE
jgi:AcrR family transcriptional regulator